MKVSKKWLNELVKLNIPYSDLGERFSLMSQEVADVYKLVDVEGLVIGEVLECDKHPEADKLSVCKVNVGEELNIVCGAPNVKKGQKVIVAKVGTKLPELKIKSAKIRGVESNGMICSLNELGIDKGLVDASGIYVLPNDAPVGDDACKYLSLDDEVLELDLTPNRGDLLSMMGVAYDTSALTGQRCSFVDPVLNEIDEKIDVEVKIDTDECMSYYARVIKDVKITDSPEWLKARLIAAGVRPINNVVDITNYVMLYTGQPLHAFDLDKFGSKKVLVRKSKKDEVIVTLDELERKLSDDIVITNGKTPTALGGVMGGFDSEIDEDTKYVLLESATFNPYSVRKTSARLGLRSESSMRFERKVDPNRTKYALNLASQMFQDIANGKVLKGISYVDNNDLNPREIVIDLDFIKKTIGYSYTVEDIRSVFDALDFEYEDDNEVFRVLIPTRRQDIEAKQDLIEEIVRIHGYDKVPLTLASSVAKGALTDKQLTLRKIRSYLEGSGLDEVITYSLVSDTEVNIFQDDKFVRKLKMPMSSERAVMRKSVIKGVLDAVRYNIARRNLNIAFYEIGSIYGKEEEQILVCAFTGMQNELSWRSEAQYADFFYVKGIVEGLFDKLQIDVEYEATTISNFHPGQTAKIIYNNTDIGFIAKLHPKYQLENDLNDTFVVEINLDMISFNYDTIKFEVINKYPEVERDLALVVDKSLPVQRIVEVIQKTIRAGLKDVIIFDLYTGENIGEDEKSVGIKLVFIDKEKTLEASEVQIKVDKVVNKLETELKAKLRE